MNLLARLRHGLGLLAVATLTCLPILAFEGRIDMTMTVPKEKAPMPLTYFVKGTLMRMEMQVKDRKHDQAMTVATIMNLGTKEMIMLMEEQQMYMVHKIPDAVDRKVADSMEKNPFKPTGRKDTIAGYAAEEYVSQAEGKWTEVWVTKELGQFMMAQGGMGGKPKQSSWEAFAKAGNFFCLRVIVRPKEGGAEEMRMETTKVDKSSQPDSLFVPPPEYKKFEMPGMGDMMKGLLH